MFIYYKFDGTWDEVSLFGRKLTSSPCFKEEASIYILKRSSSKILNLKSFQIASA